MGKLDEVRYCMVLHRAFKQKGSLRGINQTTLKGS